MWLVCKTVHATLVILSLEISLYCHLQLGLSSRLPYRDPWQWSITIPGWWM